MAAAAVLALSACVRVQVHGDPKAWRQSMAQPVRVATYNTSLYSDQAGGLVARLRSGDAGAKKIAAVLQRVRPDIVLLNEFDYVADGRAADLFQRDFLDVPQPGGGEPLRYAHRYLAPVNTGVPSGLDLGGDGRIGGRGREAGNDAWGYGLHPGQYGMLVLSRYPIDAEAARTFQLLRWSAMPGARRPIDPATGRGWHADATWAQLRLSSKSHWDVPVRTPLGTLHLLASHPTPPVFDGPENRNGLRNADELRLWTEYLDDTAGNARWLCDDAGRCGGLPADARFVLLGDLNNDPADGDGEKAAIRALLAHPRVAQRPPPRSAGAPLRAARHGIARAGDTAVHTGDFGPKAGTLRLDYALPSTNLAVAGDGVYWPAPDAPGAAISDGSDHHLVWVDLAR